MALIYLLLGSLITIVGYLLYKYIQLEKFNHQNYRTINGLLLKNQEIFKLLSKIKTSLNELDKQMKEDSYKSLSEVNQTISDTISNLKSLTQSFNNQDLEIQSSFRTVEQRFQDINVKLNQIKENPDSVERKY